jgi:hypothetical protein
MVGSICYNRAAHLMAIRKKKEKGLETKYIFQRLAP